MRKAVKMADEEECAGESSSDVLLGVRKSAKELLRAALQSKETFLLLEDTERTLTDVPSLVKEKKRLLQEKRSCLIELELRRMLSAEPLTEVSFSQDDVHERVSELEREVATLRARLSQDEQLLQRLQSSVVLTEHLFQNAHPSTEEKALRAMVMEHSSVSVEVEKICGEIGEGEREVVRIQRERAESQAHCRKLMAQIKELEEGPATLDTSSAETARLKAALQLKSAECKLLQGCLQSVIVGSGVDWSETQALRDLTVSLGHNPSWDVS